MRFAVSLLALLTVTAAAPAASLFGVHFIDAKEGWVVGDDGAILHSIDGGKTWEDQASGVKASLRGVYFFDELTGWVVGREEKPYGGGSIGVVLFTRDGGFKWQRLLENSLPGLNAVRFTDRKTGVMLGDGLDPFGSGMFRTTDGGRSWDPVRGTRTPAWANGDFQDAKNGVLVGPWGKLASYRNEQWAFADPATFGGRGLRDVKILNKRLLAVGDGGLALTSASAGQAWAHADIGLPAEVRACLDFHTVANVGDRVWIAGRPGSVILRSDDGGATWATKPIKIDGDKGAAPPLHALSFIDKETGFAVGACDRILTTHDGGETWQQTRRGERPETMFAPAQAASALFDGVAFFNKRNGGSVVMALTTEGSGAALPMGNRLHAAVRAAGGGVGEEPGVFPMPQYLEGSSKDDLVAAWNVVHGGKAPQELLRHLVLGLRTWQPSDIIADDPALSPLAGLMGEALVEAMRRAEDPREFPEQIEVLGLRPTKIRGLFAAADKGPITIDTSLWSRGGRGVPREVALSAHGLVGRRPASFPPMRSFQRLAAGPSVQGTPAFPAGEVGVDDDKSAGKTSAKAVERTTRQIVNLVERLPRSEVVLTQLVPLLQSLPDDDAARAAFQVAWAYVRMGEWDLARETFLAMVDRAPFHPLSLEAYRWLAQHNTSSEVRRRYELKHFALVNPDLGAGPGFGKKSKIQQVSGSDAIDELLPPLSPNDETRIWAKGSELLNKRFALFGSLESIDPRVQFSMQAGRRTLGEAGASRAWHEKFAAHVAKGPWGEAAAGELWVSGIGPKPRRVAGCRLTEVRPTLDGKLDDACWTTQLPLTLADASGTSQTEHATQAWLAYDAEFLYVAVRCQHPAGRLAAPVKVRQRDAQLDAHDRVSLLLDLDRDYATYFRLEVDQRGCVREDCWGDATWNPKWYVATQQTESGWAVEAAIPLGELTSIPVTLDTRWACNIVRIVPGRGVQSVSQPADVEPRPEGMCILQFNQDARRTAPPMALAP